MKFRPSAIFILIVLIFQNHISTYAQKWRTFTNKDNIKSIIQGNDGSIWAATYGGVINMDKNGKTLNSYTTENGLASNEINCIFQDSKNNLWVGSENGISIFDGKKWNNKVVENPVVQKVVNINEQSENNLSNNQNTNEPGPAPYSSDKPSNYRIREIFQDKKGNYWLCTSGRGILKYDSKKWYNYIVQDADESIDYVNCIIQDKIGSIWFGTNSGIIRFDGKEWRHFELPNKSYSNRIVKSIFEEDDGTIIFGTEEGIFKYSNNEIKLTNRDLKVNDIIKNRTNNELWISDWRQGISVFKGNEVHNLNTISGTLPFGNPQCLFQDKDNNIWLGAYGGLAKFDGTLWKKIEIKSFPLSLPTYVFQDSKNRMWIAGVLTFDLKTNEIVRYSDDGIYDIFEDKEKKMWGRTYKSIVRFNNSNNVWETFFEPKNEANSVSINCLYQDKKGRVWVGIYDGLYLFENNKWQLFNTKNSGLIYNNVSKIFEENNGKLWFLTENGISILDNNKVWNRLDISKILNSPSSIDCIFQSKEDQSIWLGTRGGIHKFNGNTWDFVYTFTFGIKNHGIKYIFQDRKNRYWYITEGSYGKCAVSMLDKDKWTHFDNKNSLLNDGNINHIYEDNLGKIWFCSNDGIVVFE